MQDVSENKKIFQKINECFQIQNLFSDLEFSYIEVENNDEEDLGLATYAILSQLGLTCEWGQDWLKNLI